MNHGLFTSYNDDIQTQRGQRDIGSHRPEKQHAITKLSVGDALDQTVTCDAHQRSSRFVKLRNKSVQNEEIIIQLPPFLVTPPAKYSGFLRSSP